MPMFSMGSNTKLAKDVAIFNLPAIITCPNCDTCKDTCYARQAEDMYKATKAQRANNYMLAREKSKTEFYELIMQELDNNKAKIVRIHESGDFFNEAYLLKWNTIIRNNPDIVFYGYTKVKLAHELLSSNKNCNMIYSFIDDIHRNYGSKEYCNSLKKLYGAFICPHTNNDKHFCMSECKECLTNDKVCFIIHGNRKGKDTYENP